MQEIYGDELIKPASELPRPQQALDREMFENAFKNKKADGGRIGFDGGGSPLQKLKQGLVDSMRPYAGNVTEDQLQLIVRDITLDMTAEQAQASVKENFIKLFGMADGGRIGFDDGKRVDKLEQRQKAYAKFLKDTNYLGTDKEFKKIDPLTKKTGTGAKPPSVQARFEKVTKYLEKLIPKLNAEDRFYTKDEVSAMVEKKFKIKPRRNEFGFKINQFLNRDYPIMRTLDKTNVKLENLIGKMLMEDKPLNDFFLKSLQKRLNLGERVVSDILKESPLFNSLKDSGMDALMYSFNREKPHAFLKKYSLSRQLKEALEMEQGLPRYTNISGEEVRSRSPKFTVMDFAKRNWNQNKGKGAVKFFDKNGKLINWSYGLKLPYEGVKKVFFKYNGKKYNSEILNNTILLKKNFPEVYENQMALNKLKNTRITDPLNKNKTITLANLVKRNQIKNYNWSPDKASFDILHSAKGVTNEPFTNLSFNTSDINRVQRGITDSVVLKENEKNKIIKNIDKVYGSGDPDAITKRQIDFAKSKKIISYESMRDNVYKSLGELAAKLDPKCAPNSADGGRIGFEFGSTACQAKAKNYLNETLQKGIVNESPAKVSLIKKILTTGSQFLKQNLNPKELLKVENLIGKPAMYATAVIETGLVADDVFRKKKPFNVAAAENFLFGNLLNLDANAARAKNLLKSNVQLSPAAKEYAQSIIDYDSYKKLDMSAPASVMAKAFGSEKYNKLRKDLEDKITSSSPAGEMDYKSALDEFEGAFKAKSKFLDAPDKPDVTPLVNKLAKPVGRRVGPMTAKQDMKIDFSLPTYDRSFPASNEFLNQYLELQGMSPLEPGQGTEIRMNLPEQRGLYGTQERFARGGLSGGDTSGPPPEKGPMSQGLLSLYKNGRKL
jgi:copper chaperone CopZ